MSSKNPSLMDTEPGGEQTQYEGQSTFQKPHRKSSGQFSSTSTSSTKVAADKSDLQSESQKRERGEKTAENIRYGEAVSEHGFGGETVGNSGSAGAEAGFGRQVDREEGESVGKARREMGYGEGSGVGG